MSNSNQSNVIDMYDQEREDNRRARINYAKSELRNFKFLLNTCHGFEGKELVLKSELEGLGKPIKSKSGKTPDPKELEKRRTHLREQLHRVQLEHANFRHRVDVIGDYLDGLKDSDRKIITDVYINGRHMEKVARENAYTKPGLKWRLDNLLSEF